MKIDKAGIYYDFDILAYHGDPCPVPSLNQSVAKILIDRSPAHAQLAHPRLNQYWQPGDAGGYDKAKAIGNAAHALIIGRSKEVVVMPHDNFRTKEAQQARDSCFDNGQIPILAHHNETARKMVELARYEVGLIGCPDAFREGRGEVVIACQYDGIWLRSLVDWICDDGNIYDYKTSGMSVAPHAIPRLMADAGWDIQAAMQERILDTIDPKGAGRRNYRFVAQENEAPFAITVNELSDDVLTIGRKKLDYAIGLWKRCMKSERWPAYPPAINRPEYPGYAEAAWLNREIKEAAQSRFPTTDHLMAG